MPIKHESGATTISSWFDRYLAAMISLIAVFAIGDLTNEGLRAANWTKHALVPPVGPCLAVAVVAIWRISRMGVRFDNQGVTIRGLFRTSRLSWPEVREFADGAASGGSDTRAWVLKIVLRDGRAITARGTLGNRNLAAIEQVATQYQIPAQLTGQPPPRAPRLPAQNRPSTARTYLLGLTSLILSIAPLAWAVLASFPWHMAVTAAKPKIPGYYYNLGGLSVCLAFVLLVINGQPVRKGRRQFGAADVVALAGILIGSIGFFILSAETGHQISSGG